MIISVVLSCFLMMVTAEEGEKESAVFLCGRELANARVAICYGAEYVSKRRQDLTTYLVRNADKWHENWPWLGRRGALSASWPRYKREEGLVDLCCLKPCTAEVILNYC